MTSADSRVVVVTGGSRGIGRALVEHLLAAGYRVASLDRTPPHDEAHPDLLSIEVDVVAIEAMEQAATRVVETFGRVDGVVCNAAIYAGLTMKRFEQIPPDEWDQVMTVNVRGIWCTVRAFSDALRKAGTEGDASVVCIASAAALSGETGVLHYVASKGAVLALTRALAREMGRDGVRVNAVAPGFTLSEGSQELAGQALSQLSGRVRSQRALARDLQPSDLAGSVEFLLSPAASFVTGQTLVVDGGVVMP